MRRPGAVPLCAVLAAVCSPARAWWPDGHGILTRAAVQALPPSVPAFFRAGGSLAAHCSFEPDIAKNRALPGLREGEAPEHFMDMELLRGQPLPATRYGFVSLCARMRLDPKDVGLLPYAVSEWTGRLALAFAQHRRWPEDRNAQAECLVYAGILAHYAQDLCQPLHVTVNYDGKVRPDGTSPHSGIHAKVDALIERLQLGPAELAAGQRPTPAVPLFEGITREMAASRSLVNTAYALERKLSSTRRRRMAAPEVVAFAAERARESVRFTDALYLAAWATSARVRLPAWLERGGR